MSVFAYFSFCGVVFVVLCFFLFSLYMREYEREFACLDLLQFSDFLGICIFISSTSDNYLDNLDT